MPSPLIKRAPSAVQMEYIGLTVAKLAPGGKTHFHFPAEECCIVPQDAQNVVVTVELGRTDDGKTDEQTFSLHGRRSPLLELSDFLYVGRGQKFSLTLSADGGGAKRGENDQQPTKKTLCVCRAYCEKTLPPKYGPTSGIQIELRGRGQSSGGEELVNFAPHTRNFIPLFRSFAQVFLTGLNPPMEFLV